MDDELDELDVLEPAEPLPELVLDPFEELELSDEVDELVLVFESVLSLFLVEELEPVSDASVSRAEPNEPADRLSVL